MGRTWRTAGVGIGVSLAAPLLAAGLGLMPLGCVARQRVRAPAPSPAVRPSPPLKTVEIDTRTPAESTSSPTKLSWPLPGGVITSYFGVRHGQPHEGIDISAPEGTDILAADDGRVIFAGAISGYGKTVMVLHERKLVTLYAHASRLLVRETDQVHRGEVIARVGQTGRASGPHLHFEVRRGEEPHNPFNFVDMPRRNQR